MIAAAAALAAALAAVLGLAAGGPDAVQVAALALVQLLVVARWYVSVDVPGHVVGVAVGAAASIGADLAVVLRDDRRPLTPVAAVLGLAMLAALLHQLTRRDGRPRLTASVAATVSLAVVGALGSCYLGARAGDDGHAFVVAGVVAAAATVAATAVPAPPAFGAAAGLVAGVLGGGLVGALSDLGLRTGLLVGLGCTAAAAVSVVVARRTPRPDVLVIAGLPLLLAAPAAFVLGRLLAP